MPRFAFSTFVPSEHRLHVLALFPRGAFFPLAMAVLVVMVMEEQSGDDGDG